MGRRISVVIPNWNGATRLGRLLSSLHRQTERAYEIIVVDNGSTDASHDVARDVQWIALPKNYGFARAVNIGVAAGGGDAVAIVNNDVTLADDFFEQLSPALAHHQFVAPRLLCADARDLLDGSFDLTSRAFCSWRAGHGFPATHPCWEKPRTIASAPLTAALFDREVFTTVGLLDEQFGSYLEDIDFGLRCALRGIGGFYQPAACAWHEGSATFGGQWNAKSVKQIARNQLLLSKKYGMAGRWPAIVGQTLWGASALKHGFGYAWFQGKIEGWRLPVEQLQVKPGDVERILIQQEREIKNLAVQRGYWSTYFSLVGSRS